MARRKSDAVRLAELELLRAIVMSPAFSFVAGITALELLQKHEVIGNTEATVAEVALGGIVTAQAIAPLAPFLTQATEAGLDVLKTVGPLKLLRGG